MIPKSRVISIVEDVGMMSMCFRNPLFLWFRRPAVLRLAKEEPALACRVHMKHRCGALPSCCTWSVLHFHLHHRVPLTEHFEAAFRYNGDQNGAYVAPVIAPFTYVQAIVNSREHAMKP